MPNTITRIDDFQHTKTVGDRIGSKMLARIMATLPADATQRNQFIEKGIKEKGYLELDAVKKNATNPNAKPFKIRIESPSNTALSIKLKIKDHDNLGWRDVKLSDFQQRLILGHRLPLSIGKKGDVLEHNVDQFSLKRSLYSKPTRGKTKDHFTTRVDEHRKLLKELSLAATN